MNLQRQHTYQICLASADLLTSLPWCRRDSGSASNELIVVTVLVAAEGNLKLPKVTSLEELRSALNSLGGISESQVAHSSTFSSV